MSGQDPVIEKPPGIPRRNWFRRMIIDPLFRVGGVRRCRWEEFYLYCFRLDPAEPIYSISGSGEFTEKDPTTGRCVIDELLKMSARPLYAITQRKIESVRWNELQEKAREANWSGSLEFLISDAIQSHLVICGDHVFLEAPHNLGASIEDRPGVMISNDPLLLDAARNTYNRILKDKETRCQWSLGCPS